MTTPSYQEITLLLQKWGDGDETALEQLLTQEIYEELKRMARGYMGGEREGHTLQPTALVNEAFERLLKWKNVRWQNRAHFLGVAAQLMRRILVDYARTHNYAKRGGAAQRVSLDEAAIVAEDNLEEIIVVHEALDRLAEFDPLGSRIVELRYFGGLSVKEVAETLKMPQRTVERKLNLALAWLYRELGGKDGA